MKQIDGQDELSKHDVKKGQFIRLAKPVTGLQESEHQRELERSSTVNHLVKQIW